MNDVLVLNDVIPIGFLLGNGMLGGEVLLGIGLLLFSQKKYDKHIQPRWTVQRTVIFGQAFLIGLGVGVATSALEALQPLGTACYMIISHTWIFPQCRNSA